VRTLDAFHMMRVVDLQHEFEERMKPLERDSVIRHRRELGAILSECGALCVAGGHVIVLQHRMRLFDVLGLLHGQPIFAWSAGAMALSERIVLFHDSPPQGPGNAELFENGLGVFPGLLPLPHARKRLRLHDKHKVALMARRFAPAQVIAFDALTRMDWDGERWHGQPGTQRLTQEGILVQAGVA
jgi:peptidase E